eukprot:9707754-Heterocapsa_arctica.AAC.1
MDASAALGLINRQGLGKARQWLWIQQATREGRVLMNKIPERRIRRTCSLSFLTRRLSMYS